MNSDYFNLTSIKRLKAFLAIIEASSYAWLFMNMYQQHWISAVLCLIIIIFLNLYLRSLHSEYSFYERFNEHRNFIYELDDNEYAFLLFSDKLGSTNKVLSTTIISINNSYMEQIKVNQDLKDQYNYLIDVLANVSKEVSKKEDADISKLDSELTKVKEVLYEIKDK